MIIVLLDKMTLKFYDSFTLNMHLKVVHEA
jgi:hypothetical protein